jgi:NADH-quinone oxidoreductase subunit J
MALEIAFWILAVVAVMAALAVVFQRDIFHAALTLILCFLAVAGLFITLSADFLAAVQVLIYVGAIAILIILGIMLTREVQRGNIGNRLGIPAFIVAALLLGVAVFAITSTPWSVSTVATQAPTVDALGLKLFGQDGFILAVEIAPVLLLAAVLGAIVLVKEK